MDHELEESVKALIKSRKAQEDAEREIIITITKIACQEFGAYTVRQAAKRHREGDSQALATVGLGGGEYQKHVLLISNTAFDAMTSDERHHEFCLASNIPYFKINNNS